MLTMAVIFRAKLAILSKILVLCCLAPNRGKPSRGPGPGQLPRCRCLGQPYFQYKLYPANGSTANALGCVILPEATLLLIELLAIFSTFMATKLSSDQYKFNEVQSRAIPSQLLNPRINFYSIFDL
uniref:Uncharacterized protein n=1 Tax=Romanomermis culicivorax TaxID=13658 RepID=A0A915HSY4_ROMCU